jgi:REP element-mobilizing transposase RayT
MAGSAIPPYSQGMPQRDHLQRLENVWIKHPIYFLTLCIVRRQKMLTAPNPAGVLTESWRAASAVHGWVIGRYVIMPDHVHFFASAKLESKSLSAFIRDWKKWTTRKLRDSGIVAPIVWQPEFFDHVLRSVDSYEEKWNYVRDNPVRAGLAASAEAWPYSGEIEQLYFCDA